MAQYCIKPSEVYTSKPEIPKGWRYAGFRPPTDGEYHLGRNSAGLLTWSGKSFWQNCRIIVEPEAPKVSPNKVFVVSTKDIYDDRDPEIPEGWRAVTFRYPSEGETYLGNASRLIKTAPKFWSKVLGPRLILEPIAPEPDAWWE